MMKKISNIRCGCIWTKNDEDKVNEIKYEKNG